jgi:hypothetical protein
MQKTRGTIDVLNFVGRISEIMFGTLSDEDAVYYQHSISYLET